MSERRMHVQAKLAMKKRLADHLSSCEIKDGFPGSIFEWGNDFGIYVMKYKRPWLKAFDILRFIFLEIRAKLDFSEGKPSGNLKQFVQVDSLAGELVDLIDSYPRDYDLYFNLGKASFGENLILSEKVSLLRMNGRSPEVSFQYSEKNGLGFAEAVLKDKFPFKPGETWLKISISGYSRGDEEDSAVAGGLEILKAFLAIGNACGFFVKTGSWVRHIEGEKNKLLIFDKEEHRRVVSKIFAHQDIIEHLNCYNVCDDTNQHLSVEPSPIGMSGAAKLSTADAGCPELIPLKTGAVWAFDSSSNKNETVSFIQLCIAIEAVLGEEESSESLSKSLGDRCAYLLGRKPTERSIIRENFKELYKRRSKLVHGRRARLGPDDQDSWSGGDQCLSKY